MSVIKNDFPILEYDSEKTGVIMPNRHKRALLPEACVMTFFGETLDAFAARSGAEIRNSYNSEMRDFPVYVTEYKGVELCLIQAAVGSASAAMMTDFLIGYGVKKIIACGGCGVLDHIPAGDVILPISALRDEGASYHYLPPAREIAPDRNMVERIKRVLLERDVPFVECKTWTTDAFYRETPDMIRYRKEEGCRVVEMECAAIAAVSAFRGVQFGQLLYSGDILADPCNYDDRGWFENLTAREKLFFLALEAAAADGE